MPKILNLNINRIRFLLSRIKERLWVKPMVLCVLSVAGTFVAMLADDAGLSGVVPDVAQKSVESLLTIMASSMLVIATFSVGSMVAAYASASAGATPRSIPLVIADGVTQNAISAFIGAFIFSIVSLIVTQNDMFQSAGLFAMFAQTLLVFAIVIFTFVRWIDRIARLGRVVHTIEQVERAACEALNRRHHASTLGGVDTPVDHDNHEVVHVYAKEVGYVQHIDMEELQSCAMKMNFHVEVMALPGAFVSAWHPLLCVRGCGNPDSRALSDAFEVSPNRAFEDDPRFGVVVLSEIAGKALSVGINDPGTAINVIGSMVRLLSLWQCQPDEDQVQAVKYDHVSVPRIKMDDLFDDAFTAIARDGAGIIEVSIRLQKALCALSKSDDPSMVAAAIRHSRMALVRSRLAMSLPEDIDAVLGASKFSSPENNSW